jgi:hypothetical protein
VERFRETDCSHSRPRFGRTFDRPTAWTTEQCSTWNTLWKCKAESITNNNRLNEIADS